MSTKNNPGLYDGYARAEPDEPYFVLLGRDPHAPEAVEKWAADRYAMIKAGRKPETDMDKIEEANRCAKEMRVYRRMLEARSINSELSDELADAVNDAIGNSDGRVNGRQIAEALAKRGMRVLRSE